MNYGELYSDSFIATDILQLEFSLKLYYYALDGHIDIQKLDIPCTVKEGRMIFVLSDKIFETRGDLDIVLGNNIGVAFGAAAIILNWVREKAHLTLPNPIVTEADQFVALTYQIRSSYVPDTKCVRPRYV